MSPSAHDPASAPGISGRMLGTSGIYSAELDRRLARLGRKWENRPHEHFASQGSDPTEIAGRYEVIQKLGAGAFGTVYKAKDRILGRMLAIKTIRVESLAAAGASYEEMLNRFKREAQISAKLKHPNIVTIYDIGDSDGMSYLAMEFIDGMGLEKIISQGGRLSLERAAAIGAQVADALDFAHKNSVVHGTSSPQTS